MLDKAASKARHAPPDGTFNSRVLMKVLKDAGHGDDEVVAEYFGGILASSTTADGKDDRGIVASTMLAQMSSYALHYLVLRVDSSDLTRARRQRVYVGRGCF